MCVSCVDIWRGCSVFNLDTSIILGSIIIIVIIMILSKYKQTPITILSNLI